MKKEDKKVIVIAFICTWILIIASTTIAQVKITASVQENECNKCLEMCREVCK